MCAAINAKPGVKRVLVQSSAGDGRFAVATSAEECDRLASSAGGGGKADMTCMAWDWGAKLPASATNDPTVGHGWM